MTLQLIIGADSAEAAAEISQGLEGLSVQVVYRSDYDLVRTPRLDAVFLPPTYAERWGARPLFHRAQVLEIPQKDRADGFPPYCVAGVGLTNEEFLSHARALSITLTAIAHAVSEFNKRGDPRIRVLGASNRDFKLEKLSPNERRDAFRGVTRSEASTQDHSS